MIHNGHEIKPFANLKGVDFFRVNLQDANLQNANLYRIRLEAADLWKANLQGANLQWANLKGAGLQKVNFRGANLQNANLWEAALLGADLRGANLRNANLWETYLARANFDGANLEGTCLDPSNEPNGEVDAFERDEAGWCIGYRTMRSPCLGGLGYEPGKSYKAPIFSTADTKCHPGLYLAPVLHEVQQEYYLETIVRVITPPEEIHKAGSKYRCRWFVVAGEINNDS